MLSETSFIVNHWITILWLVAAGLYTSFAIVVDIYRAKAHVEEVDHT